MTTFKLGAKSLTILTGVEPTLISVVKRAIEITTEDFSVHEGVRSLETQKEYFARKVTKTLSSKHLLQPDGFGHAVDLVPFIAGQLRWEWPPIYHIAAAMAQAAKELDVLIRWGGVWDKTLGTYGITAEEIEAEVKAYCTRHPGPDFLDGPHYELV